MLFPALSPPSFSLKKWLIWIDLIWSDLTWLAHTPLTIFIRYGYILWAQRDHWITQCKSKQCDPDPSSQCHHTSWFILQFCLELQRFGKYSSHSSWSPQPSARAHSERSSLRKLWFMKVSLTHAILLASLLRLLWLFYLEKCVIADSQYMSMLYIYRLEFEGSPLCLAKVNMRLGLVNFCPSTRMCDNNM